MKAKVVTLFSVFIFLISPNVLASVSSRLANEVSNCSKVSSDKQRLACFDKLTQSMMSPNSTIKESREPIPQVKQAISTEAKKIDDFSKQHLKKTQQADGPNSIIATISKVKKLMRGQWVIYLENGQKWQQKDSGKIKLKVGDSIRLKKGSMGAVYLFKKGSSRNIRVKRLK